MKEFTDFIEEVVEVEDQTDPDNNNIIHAFYRNHNTLNKMNENFRLLEYKRKQYIKQQKERKSQSPPKIIHNTHNSASSVLLDDPSYVNTPVKAKEMKKLSPPTQKNFMTSLYRSSDLVQPTTDGGSNSPAESMLKSTFQKFA